MARIRSSKPPGNWRWKPTQRSVFSPLSVSKIVWARGLGQPIFQSTGPDSSCGGYRRSAFAENIEFIDEICDLDHTKWQIGSPGEIRVKR